MSTTRVPARIAALAAASALVLAAAPSWADESGSPSASPEATTTSEQGTTNPTFDVPETVDTYVGQSVQVRKNADGLQNSDLANFRWNVTQVNAESLNGLDVSVPLPMDDAPGLRSLTGRSNMPTVVDGGVLYDFDAVDGIQTKRTLNLWPQDRPLPVDVTAEFTLDGEKVSAQDIVGKGGLVTATYTIVNQSVKTQDVKFENVQGEDDTEEVETSQAFVGISKTFIPQSWAQFDAGKGIFGADGRGNYQTQWISLAFLPFAEDGKASFGWSAVVPEGEGYIPKMTIEVSPLYVPTHVGEEEDGGAVVSNAVPRPNMDAATATVHSGVEELIAGVDSLAATVGKTKEEVKEGVSIAVSQVKAALAELCTPELLDCYAPEPEDPLELSEVIATLDQTIAAINDYVAQAEGGTDPRVLVDYLNRIEEDVTETLTEAQAALAEAEAAIVEANAAIAEANTAKAEATNAKAEAEAALATNQQVLADLEATLADQTTEYEQNCLTTSIEGETDYGPKACADLQKIINNTEKAIQDTQKAIDQNERSIKANDLTIAAADASIKKNELTIARSEAAIKKNELTIAAAERALTAVNEAQAYVDENIGNLSTEALRDLSEKLTKANDALKAIQAQLDLIAPPLADLAAGIDSIGAAIDSGLANLSGAGASLDQIASGKAQISAGLGAASEDIQNYIAEVVAVAQAAAEGAAETAAEVEAQANTIKAEMAGLLGRMAESPLPYGGGMNTVFAPAGDTQAVQDEATALVSETGPVDPSDTVQPTTELFGAYQFMLDPADRMRPTVPWRIGLAILLVIGGGFLGMRFAKRKAT